MINDHFKGNFVRQRSLPEAIGVSEAFVEFQENLSRVASIDRPVLIVGERGTGKELAANRLHFLSLRWDGPFVALNCAALNESVLESELFGHEQGAFTGAAKRRQGRFEIADQGTLFLDEIGLTSISVQEKLLRAVEYKAFERLGGSVSVEVDVRIIGATNADLKKMAKTGQFKEDLLDRLSFEVLFLPPLRVRAGDVPYLAQHYAAKMARELGREASPTFSVSAMRSLEVYEWPGNIRELKNVVERSVYRSDDDMIRQIEFDPFVSPFGAFKGPLVVDSSLADVNQPAVDVSLSLPEAIKALELRRLKDALLASNYKQSAAASDLGLTYHQFRSLYRKYHDEL